MELSLKERDGVSVLRQVSEGVLAASAGARRIGVTAASLLTLAAAVRGGRRHRRGPPASRSDLEPGVASRGSPGGAGARGGSDVPRLRTDAARQTPRTSHVVGVAGRDLPLEQRATADLAGQDGFDAVHRDAGSRLREFGTQAKAGSGSQAGSHQRNGPVARVPPDHGSVEAPAPPDRSLRSDSAQVAPDLVATGVDALGEEPPVAGQVDVGAVTVVPERGQRRAAAQPQFGSGNPPLDPRQRLSKSQAGFSRDGQGRGISHSRGRAHGRSACPAKAGNSPGRSRIGG